MPRFLEAGPFSARDGEGRRLFSDAVVWLRETSVVLLEGASGSGKSTLLRHVVAMDGGIDGRRSLSNEEFEGSNLPIWRSKVTLLAQDAPMLPGSVQHNLEFAFRFRSSCAGDFDRDRAAELMARVGLALPLARDVATLSGGERHRLALVRGLLWDPPVLLADEPLAGLDSETASVCLRLLVDFARRPGHALLLVLHDDESGASADARIRLHDGRVVVR
jgi:putative ABC transport system ATP-binding protein